MSQQVVHVPPVLVVPEHPIARWLRERGLRQTWLRAALDLNSGSVSLLVRGLRAPSIWTLARLHRATGGTLDIGEVCSWYAAHYQGRKSALRRAPKPGGIDR